ncbi:MAG TPA: response regulator transcription factor [Vicinamibacterales bacterium]|jgi:DNA-binding NarL/FixJ family response regulator|nr:response regulator transcription factor [Vicinamibacterales bacterium]
MPRIRVVIADDHAILREGLRALLAAAGDIDVIGEASDGREAVEACQKLNPDILLLDVSMPGLGGFEALLDLRRNNSTVKVLVLSQYDHPESIRRFVQAGASGYLLKRSVATDLARAIRAVARGGLVLDPEIARSALADRNDPGRAQIPDDPYESLTDREKQVLKLVAEGMSSKAVAEALGISVKTAMSHREHLMEKLGLHNRTDLIRFALRREIIQPQ